MEDKLLEFKEKYGFKEKIVLCDFNAVRGDKPTVHAYTRHVEELFPTKGHTVICFQGDDSVWMRGTVVSTPKIGRYYDSIGHTFDVELDWDDFGYIEEDTFSDALKVLKGV